MKFLNNNLNRKFRLLEGKDCFLYIYGYTNMNDQEILKQLMQDKFPSSIRGQFAFVFLTEHDWIACVDHLATTNLFYTQDQISPDYFDLKGRTPNKNIQEQLVILKIHTVGSETLYKEIKRTEPETYVKNGVIKKYSDILNHPNKEFDVEEAYSYFEAAAGQVDLTNSNVCLSGGKDSAWIAMFLKHLGYDPRLIHITSPNIEHSVDDDACDLYRKECGWNIENYEVEYTGEIEKEDYIFTTFWKENIFPVKKHAMKNHSGITLSGEVSEMEVKKQVFNFYLDNMRGKINNEHLINYYMYLQYSHNKNNSFFPMTSEIWHFPRTEGHQYILDYYNNILDNSQKPNKYLTFWYLSFCTARVWHESQDKDNYWFNLFTDYNVFDYFIHTNPPKNSVDYLGISRAVKPKLYEIGSKKFSTWSDISWRFKTEGMGIPPKSVFNEEQI